MDSIEEILRVYINWQHVLTGNTERGDNGSKPNLYLFSIILPWIYVSFFYIVNWKIGSFVIFLEHRIISYDLTMDKSELYIPKIVFFLIKEKIMADKMICNPIYD